MIAWLLGSFVVLMVLGVPIGISLGLASMGGILLLDGGNIVTVAQRTFEGMNSWALLAVPLYTFAGYTMSKGGVSKNLMDFCYSIVGHIYGGLAHVNVFASMIFAGISGSAVADTAGVSGMFMPQMVKKGYSTELSVAVTGVSSTIGIIIPPSIPMVVIAGICGISTGKMFVGGIIPGILIGLMQMILSYFFAKKEGVEKEPGHFTFGAVGRAFLKSWPALMMPVIIIGTITSGIVSPTEAGPSPWPTAWWWAVWFTGNSPLRTSSLPSPRRSASPAGSLWSSAPPSSSPSCSPPPASTAGSPASCWGSPVIPPSSSS